MQKTVFDRLPFDGEWLVFWGGDTAELNHHHGNPVQNFAFDFVNGDIGNENDSFGQNVLSVADGEVVEVVDGIRDNKPSETNDYMFLGNHVVIRHGEIYTVTAHLKQDSVCVRRGEAVRAGQKIGLCGNSGNSTEPHLHLHAQNAFTYSAINSDHTKNPVAQAVKVHFSGVNVNGEKRKDYSPVKGDRVGNI